jgi:prevent-host-death family protein
VRQSGRGVGGSHNSYPQWIPKEKSQRLRQLPPRREITQLDRQGKDHDRHDLGNRLEAGNVGVPVDKHQRYRERDRRQPEGNRDEGKTEPSEDALSPKSAITPMLCPAVGELRVSVATVEKHFATAVNCPARRLVSGRYIIHMTKQVTATDAKATILRLLDDAAAGEEIEITRHGRPVARLVPASGARSLEGSFDGVAVTAVEEEQLFSTGEAWNAS